MANKFIKKVVYIYTVVVVFASHADLRESLQISSLSSGVPSLNGGRTSMYGTCMELMERKKMA